MTSALLKTVMIAAWLFIGVEVIVLGLGFLSIAVGETAVGGGAMGLLAQCVGMLRTALYGVVPLAILLVVIRIYQKQGA